MPTPPILKHRSINYLLKEIMSSHFKTMLQHDPKPVNIMRLAPAAAIAYFLTKTEMQFKKEDEVNLLIAGASGFDARDYGYFYQFIPYLIGREKNLSVKITLIGNELGPELHAFDPRYQVDSIQMKQTSLAKFIKANDLAQYDLAVFFHPGYEAHWQEWFIDDQPAGIKELIRSGIPVMGTSYDQQECGVDEDILNEFGYSMKQSYENPFYFDTTQYGGPRSPISINWGAIIWQLGNDIPSEDHEPDLNLVRHMRTEYEGVEAEDYAESILEAHGKFQHINMPKSAKNTVEWAQKVTDENDSFTDAEMFNHISDLLGQSGTNILGQLMEGMTAQKEITDPVEEELFSLLDMGDVEAAMDLLRENKELANATNQDYQNCYHYAAILNKAELVAAIKDCGVDINNQDNEGWTALMEAARKGAGEALDALIDAGADIELGTTLGWNALGMAVYERQEESVKRLLKAGANPNQMMPMGVTISEMAKMAGVSQSVLDMMGATPS